MMDDQLLPWIIFAGGAGCWCVLFLLIATLFGGGLILFFRKFSTVFSEVEQGLAQPTGDYLAEAEQQLLPWTADALEDLSAYLVYYRQGGLGRLHGRGWVKSLRQPEAPGWLVFDLQVQPQRGSFLHFSGKMTMKSSQHTWTFTYEGLRAREISVLVNGFPWGSLVSQKDAVALLDPDDRPVGLYHRPRLVVYRGVNPRFGAVEIEGRPVAEVNYNPVTFSYKRQTVPPSPLIQNPAADLSENEEVWLLTLVGREVMYSLLRTREPRMFDV